MHCGVIMGTTVHTICKSYISTTDICGHPRSADYLKPFRQKRAHFLVTTNWNVIYRTQIIIDIILAIAAVLMAAVGLNGINRPAHCWCCCCCCCWDDCSACFWLVSSLEFNSHHTTAEEVFIMGAFNTHTHAHAHTGCKEYLLLFDVHVCFINFWFTHYWGHEILPYLRHQSPLQEPAGSI